MEVEGSKSRVRGVWVQGGNGTSLVLSVMRPMYVCHTPYTLHPIPYTPPPTLYTLHATSYTLHPAPYTLHSTARGPLKWVQGGRHLTHTPSLVQTHSLTRTHTHTHTYIHTHSRTLTHRHLVGLVRDETDVRLDNPDVAVEQPCEHPSEFRTFQGPTPVSGRGFSYDFRTS